MVSESGNGDAQYAGGSASEHDDSSVNEGPASRGGGDASLASASAPTTRTQRPSRNARSGPPRADARNADPKPARKRQPKSPQVSQPVVLSASGLVKRFGQHTAVDHADLEIRRGSIFGVVGPNGAGKTTTLSMIAGLLRPDQGSVTVLGRDVWSDAASAKRAMGVLPDRLRLFDRLTGAQLLHYAAVLRGVNAKTADARAAELAGALGLTAALSRPVSDYSVGMAKKVALASALVHAPRVLVLDEPFESVDPVSVSVITEILRGYAAEGGSVVLSSHSMELVQRTCDSVAIIVGGRVLASGTMTKVRGRKSLETVFVELAGGGAAPEGMAWLRNLSD